MLKKFEELGLTNEIDFLEILDEKYNKLYL